MGDCFWRAHARLQPSCESEEEYESVAEEFYDTYDTDDIDADAALEERITRLINVALREESVTDRHARKTYKAMLIALARFRKDDELVDYLRKVIPLRIPERDGPGRIEWFLFKVEPFILIGILCLIVLGFVLAIVSRA